MTNETLVTQLDTLRETYIQQQKAVAGLQAAIKGVTNAHSKAQKALRDLGILNSSVSADGLNVAQEAFSGSRLKEVAVYPLLPDIQRELKSLATLTGALKDASSALRSEPVDVVRLDKALLPRSNWQSVLTSLCWRSGHTTTSFLWSYDAGPWLSCSRCHALFAL